MIEKEFDKGKRILSNATGEYCTLEKRMHICFSIICTGLYTYVLPNIFADVPARTLADLWVFLPTAEMGAS